MTGLKRLWLVCLCGAIAVGCGDDDTGNTPDTGYDGSMQDGSMQDGDTQDGGPDVCEGVPANERCDTAGLSCDGVNSVTCAANENGCLVITNTTNCSEAENGICVADTGMCGVDQCAGVTNCAIENRTCDGNELVVCAPDANGCLVEARTDCGASNTTCDSSGMPACVDSCAGVTNCSAEGRTCNGDSLVVCTPDANGCLVETATDCTTTDEVCGNMDGMAVCMADSCAPAAANPVLNCATGTITGTTVGGTEVFGADNNACTSSNRYSMSPERVFTFEATSTATVTIQVVRDAADDEDMDLFVLDGNATCETASTCLARSIGGSATETVEFDVNAGTSAFVVYDSYTEMGSAAYTLTVTCEEHVCGDGMVSGPETCDDGNSTAGDGCSDACVLEPGYICETPGMPCALSCGDGMINGADECDDGNTTAGDGCSDMCAIEPGYFCETPGMPCALSCGDGMINGADECDDGNTTAGDGCSDTCALEPGYICETPGMPCEFTCGDGVLNGGDVCDDGNTTAGDGCSVTCLPEMDYRCVDEPSMCDNTGVDAWFEGVLDSSDMTWNRIRFCTGTPVTTPVSYEVFQYQNTSGAPELIDVVSTYSRSLDGYLHIYTGGFDPMDQSTGCGASDDDERFGSATGARASRIEGFELAAGETAYIVVSGFGATSLGGFSVSVIAEAAPVCGNGVVEGDEYCDDGNTVDGDGCAANCTGIISEMGALDSMDSTWNRPGSSCSGSNADRTYDVVTFVAPATTTYTATASWGFDGFLHVYSDPFDASMPLDNCISGNDDFGGTTGSRVTLNATAGTTYHFVLSSYGANVEGNWTFSITE